MMIKHFEKPFLPYKKNPYSCFFSCNYFKVLNAFDSNFLTSYKIYIYQFSENFMLFKPWYKVHIFTLPKASLVKNVQEEFVLNLKFNFFCDFRKTLSRFSFIYTLRRHRLSIFLRLLGTFIQYLSHQPALNLV